MIVKPAVSFLTNNSDAVLITDVSNIVTSVTNNKDIYASPIPALAVISSANVDFATAVAEAADGGKQLTSAKNAKRAIVVSLMRQLASYVAVACGDDMTKLLSSGFPVQKPNRTPANVPTTPDAPKVLQGKSGQAFSSAKPVAGAYIYNHRVALVSAPDTYVQTAQSTGARCEFNGLTPGENYAFEMNAVGTAGASDYSDAGTLIVI